MANYPLTPINLATLDETTPTGAEDAAKIDDAILQTRYLLKKLMQVEHNDDGTHKNIGTSGLANNAVTSAKIGSKEVKTANIDDKAVTATQLASDNAVDGNRAVGTDHIKDVAITTNKLANNAVTGAKMGTGANGADTANIKDGAVTLAKAAADLLAAINAGVTTGAVGPTNISNIGLSKILVGDGVNAQAGDIGGVVTATWDNTAKQLVFAFAPSAIPVSVAIIVERGSDGATATGGNTSAAAWVSRPGGGSAVMAIQDDPQQLFELVAPAAGTARVIKFKKKGTYMAHLHVMGYNSTAGAVTMVGRLAKVSDLSTTPISVSETLLTTEISTLGVSSVVKMDGFDVFTIDNDNTLVAIQQYSSAASTNGLGNGTVAISGIPYKFAQLQIIKLS